MSIQFPANPPLNDTFDYDDKTYIWDGEKWTASAIGSFDEAYVNISGDTMTGDLTVPSLNGGPLAGFRNALINGDYAIAQRYSNYPWTATGVQTNANPESLFGPDRWSTPQFREFQSRTERPSNFFVGSVQWRTGTQSNAVWNQVIELEGNGTSVPRNDFLLGCDAWTISHWIFAADRNNFVCDVEYVNESYSPSVSQSIAAIADGDWQTVETQGDWIRVAASFSMSGVAAAPAGALGVRVQFRNDGNIRAVGAQFEPGSVATPFEQRPIGTELSLCQRYCNVIRSTAAGGPTAAEGYQHDPTSFLALFHPPIPLRSSPTFSTQGGLGVVVSEGTTRPITALTVNNPNGTLTTQLKAVATSNASVGAGGTILMATGTGNAYIFDAEL